MTIERGWYPDPSSPHQLRWWTGQLWTAQTQPLPPEPAPMPERTRHAADVWLPQQMVEYGYLPPVCVRHGLPAVRMQRAPSYSRTPLWVIPFMFVGLLLALLIAVAIRVTVWGAWPVCEVCESRRRQLRNATLGCLAASGLTVVAAIGLSPQWLVLEVLIIPAAIVFWALADWSRVTSSFVDRKLAVVRLKKPSPGFVAALNQSVPSPARAYSAAPW
ncbi:MAG TPA: DUF2510 domain-containing protein [Frankiaceae bacterium]|jgi:hypothetical protein|nr:DUF2510 domain-containing protein [Frankiaceae bacterium]